MAKRKQTLEECEAAIERGLQAQWELADIFREVRDKRLYSPPEPHEVEGLSSDVAEFAALWRCLESLGERAGLERAHVGRLMEVADVRDQLAAAGCDPMPRYVHQVLPLVKVREEDRVGVWNEACQRAREEEVQHGEA